MAVVAQTARLLEGLRRGLAENARAALLGAQERERRRQLDSALYIANAGGFESFASRVVAAPRF
jgi:hypothetical protein